MEPENTLIWEVSATEFLFVTIILGGGAAYLTGRALASNWNSKRLLVLYTILLTAAVRFIHFALFRGTLISPWYYAVDLVVLLVFAFVGMRMTRARQMTTQYGFLYDRAGLFGWKSRG